MKHNWTITILLISFFVLAQFTGLYLLNKESKISINSETNSSELSFSDTAIGGRPETTGAESLIYIVIAIIIGTILILVIARFGKTNIWRAWFFLAVWMALCVSLGSVIKKGIFFEYDVAIFLAVLLTVWKIFRPNIYVHNTTEILMYAGIGLIIVPIFELKWALILLLVISVYDMYAVWKSKHMVKLAKFQSESNMFAGLMISYRTSGKDNQNLEILSGKESRDLNNPKNTHSKNDSNKLEKTVNSKIESEKLVNTKAKIRSGKTSPQNAILGGGDIVFPLIFIGSFMNGLIIKMYASNPNLTIDAIKGLAFLESSIIVATATIALSLLFVYAKKGKFYPAMPFLTAGCLLGWLITLLI